MLATATSQVPFTPPERPFSAKATIWIKTHPITTIVAYILAAAVFATIMAVVPMAKEIQLGVGFGGGGALFIALVILKINMSGEAYVKALLGLERLNEFDELYFEDNNKKMHSVRINHTDREWWLEIDPEAQRALEIRSDQINIQSTGWYQAGITLDALPELLIYKLRKMVYTIDTRCPAELLVYALGQVPTNNTLTINTHTVEFTWDGSTWNAKIPPGLTGIPKITPSNQVETYVLVSSRRIELNLVNYFRAANKGSA